MRTRSQREMGAWALLLLGGIAVLPQVSAAGDGIEGVRRSCPAANLLVSQGTDDYWHDYYGGAEWTQMTAAMDGATASVTIAPNFEDLNYLLSFDALWLDHRGRDVVPTSNLSATEISNIGQFIATGRRLVLIGENEQWVSWNNQILGIVGGSFAGGGNSEPSSPVLIHELTAGISQVFMPAPGLANGGTPLFAHNFATLWGPHRNVLTLLEINLQGDTYWANLDNSVFATNLAAWIGCRNDIFTNGFESGDSTMWSATVQ